jgi:hypothetical protein
MPRYLVRGVSEEEPFSAEFPDLAEALAAIEEAWNDMITGSGPGAGDLRLSRINENGRETRLLTRDEVWHASRMTPEERRVWLERWWERSHSGTAWSGTVDDPSLMRAYQDEYDAEQAKWRAFRPAGD